MKMRWRIVCSLLGATGFALSGCGDEKPEELQRVDGDTDGSRSSAGIFTGGQGGDGAGVNGIEGSRDAGGIAMSGDARGIGIGGDGGAGGADCSRPFNCAPRYEQQVQRACGGFLGGMAATGYCGSLLAWACRGLPSESCIYDLQGDLVYWQYCGDTPLRCGTGTFNACVSGGRATDGAAATVAPCNVNDIQPGCSADSPPNGCNPGDAGATD